MHQLDFNKEIFISRMHGANIKITVYILPKHPHITKPTQTHTLQNPHVHTNTLQNNIKPPQCKLKQTQYKVYPNEIVTI